MSMHEEDEDFVQNDSGGDSDEFEKRLEQSYQQRKEKSSRPESSNRLMSAKARPSDLKPLKTVDPQAIEEEKDNETQREEVPNKINVPYEQTVYGRFSKFVNDNKIERDEFCRPIHIFITQEELQEFFQTVAFPVSKDEVFLIFKDHNAHKTGYLPMEEFYSKLRCWKNYKPKDYVAVFQEEKNQLLERASGAGSKKRPTTAVVAGAKGLRALQQTQQKSRMDSANKMKSTNQMGQSASQVEIGKTLAEDKTKFYLKMAKLKKEEEERELALTIDKGKRESEFDCLHKMGEACELAKMLNVPISFSAFKGPDGSLKIHFFQFVEDPSRKLDEDEEDDHN